jgi:1,4-dihydroxy-2-naphthoate octaprenyltransferase
MGLAPPDIRKRQHVKIWLLAIRPKTLPAAAAPVVVGAALAYGDGGFQLITTVVILLVALLLQIGSNLANDVFDYEKGADEGERLGPTRVAQSGLLTPGEIKRGMGIVFGASAILGLYLVFIGGWPILLLGVTAILAAIAYTGGPYPLGYHGLGEAFVFLFFGLAAVAGTYYLQIGAITPVVWWMAVVMGLLITAILVVNNLRDLENDRRSGKRTLAARFGPRFARLEYLFCILAAYFIPAGLILTGRLTPWAGLALLTLPLTARLVRSVYADQGRALNKTLAGTGQLALFYALTFALGMLLEQMR